jgi:hypothetical protein
MGLVYAREAILCTRNMDLKNLLYIVFAVLSISVAFYYPNPCKPLKAFVFLKG